SHKSSKRGFVFRPRMFLQKQLFARADVMKKQHQDHLNCCRQFQTTRIVERLRNRVRQDVHMESVPAGLAIDPAECFREIPGMIKEGRLSRGIRADYLA